MSGGGRQRPPAPRASYRLQLRGHGVDLEAARRLLPYLARLGVSHLYLSPIQHARTGSTHGYDGVDPRIVDPVLGGERALERLAEAARAQGLGLILDVVPNHLAAHPENPFFADVLARGPGSRFADWFDIDWEAGGGRLVLPVLAAPRRACLERGEVRLEEEDGRVQLRAGGLRLPLADGTRPPGADLSPAALEGLLRRQHYELVYWRRASPRTNYRRFFDVNELVAVRCDEPRVFAGTHGAVADFLEQGWIDGLRVDHVDGLGDPDRYLRLLRRLAPAPKLLLVEKILAPDESLPRRWPVDGTTGYEYLNAAEALFQDAAGCARLERGWARRVGARGSFDAAARAGRRRAVRELLQPELRRAARALEANAPRGRPLDAREARSALEAFASHLDAYRVYPRRAGLGDDERRRVRGALTAAARDGAPRRALAVLRRVLLAAEADPARLDAARRVQQLCGAAAAKGVEDTALYAHAPLHARAEVGGEPGRPLGDPVADFHAAMSARVRRPRGLLAACTHDTKRSADVRARLDVLSERPEVWHAALDRWRRQNAGLRRRAGGPDPRTELFFYQTLMGIWPPGGMAGLGVDERRALADRVDAYMRKAMREAKRETRWIDPDEGFERALQRFVRGALLPPRGRSSFLDDADRFACTLVRPGLWNALARRLLQLTTPGIPDVYQGDECWRFDLVDPDNRRPVDFRGLARRLASLEGFDRADAPSRARLLRAWLARPEDGRLALHVVRRTLAARRRAPELFLGGAYAPVRAVGEGAERILAFARRRGRRAALVVVPRLTAGAVPEPGAAPCGEAAWGDTCLRLPPQLAGVRLHRVLAGGEAPRGSRPRLAEVLASLPVAMWTTDREPDGARRPGTRRRGHRTSARSRED